MNELIKRMKQYPEVNEQGGLFTYGDIVLLAESGLIPSNEYQNTVEYYKGEIKQKKDGTEWFYFKMDI